MNININQYTDDGLNSKDFKVLYNYGVYLKYKIKYNNTKSVYYHLFYFTTCYLLIIYMILT